MIIPKHLTNFQPIKYTTCQWPWNFPLNSDQSQTCVYYKFQWQLFAFYNLHVLHWIQRMQHPLHTCKYVITIEVSQVTDLDEPPNMWYWHSNTTCLHPITLFDNSTCVQVYKRNRVVPGQWPLWTAAQVLYVSHLCIPLPNMVSSIVYTSMYL